MGTSSASKAPKVLSGQVLLTAAYVLLDVYASGRSTICRKTEGSLAN